MGDNGQFDRLLERHQDAALSAEVRIPDEEPELTWHAFLGHHDFWRFRGDQFFLVGRKSFVPLRRRQPSLGVDFLATVWQKLESANPEGLAGRHLLRRYRWSGRNPTPKENLRGDLSQGGAEALEFLSIWDEFRMGTSFSYACVLYDSYVLAARFSSSFRDYLLTTCAGLAGGEGVSERFPKLNWTGTVAIQNGTSLPLEDALAESITRDFAVGAEVARYLFCDWLLDLWYHNRAMMFYTYKHDENAQNFGEKYGWYSDRPSFLALCRQRYPDLPPRVINECIWLHQNQQCDCLGDTDAKPRTGRRPSPARPAESVDSQQGGVGRFVDDDAGYLRWLEAHPNGFVLNCARRPKRDYLMLHRAGCRTIRGKPARGDVWTRDLIKVCADARDTVAEWARKQTGATPKPCGVCHA